MASKQYSVSPDQLVHDYGSMVSAVCRRMMQDEETARETAQEIWLEVMKSLPSFQGRSKLSTWLYTIAYRIAIRCAKKEKVYSTRFLRNYFRDGERDFPDDVDIDKKIWVKEMCDKCLTGILHCLNNEARIAYIFRDIAELPYEDISRILRKESSSVRQLISRSRRKLKRFLESECALYNPHGACACRMKKLVMEMDLPDEYNKLRKMVTRANVFREAEQVMPGKNYWEKFL
jgi:RNA polymerase sigma factor (sigma-70 family)